LSNKFNIESLGRSYDTADLQFSRRMLSVGALAGTLLAVLGTLLLVLIPVNASVRQYSAPIVVLVGLTVALTAFATRVTVHSSSREISVDEDGIRLLGFSGEDVRLSWEEPSLKLEIGDYRAVPVDQRLKGMESVEFLLRTRHRLDAAIPHEAVRCILEQARKHNLEVSGWAENRTSPGPVRVIRVFAR
jgi:hypothetical protein